MVEFIGDVLELIVDLFEGSGKIAKTTRGRVLVFCGGLFLVGAVLAFLHFVVF